MQATLGPTELPRRHWSSIASRGRVLAARSRVARYVPCRGTHCFRGKRLCELQVNHEDRQKLDGELLEGGILPGADLEL